MTRIGILLATRDFWDIHCSPFCLLLCLSHAALLRPAMLACITGRLPNAGAFKSSVAGTDVVSVDCGITTAGVSEIYWRCLALGNTHCVLTTAVFFMIQDCSGTLSPRPSKILRVPTAKWSSSSPYINGVSASVSHTESNEDHVSKRFLYARINDSKLPNVVRVVLQRQHTQGEDASCRFSLPFV